MNNFLEVNVSNILNNLKYISSLNEGKKICIPVKANAYGFGIEIVDYFVNAGYDFFAVSTLEEAVFIKEKYNNVDVLIFSAVFQGDYETIKKNNIIISIYDLDDLKDIDSEIRFHLKFDTGMGRLGFKLEQTQDIINIIESKSLKIEGIYTHLAKAIDDEYANKQINLFKEIYNSFENIHIKYVHYSNGLAALKYTNGFDNMIRPGLASYGYFEKIELAKQYPKIKPSAKLKLRISMFKKYKGNVGYDGVDTVDGSVVTLSVGYYDGIKQQYRGYEIPNFGKIIGKICMCQMMVETNEQLNKGDYIYLFKDYDIYNLSEHSNVSMYEIITALNTRILRVYMEE